MSKEIRVNVRTLVNASKIRHEKRDGRDVIIVPSATLPDNVVMNGIRYPADVIASSFHTLEGTPAPLGHPKVNGKFVSARDPQGMVRTFVGAWNENVRRENGRVLLDKVIDVEFAGQSEGGKAVLNAIEKQEPISTSTGLLATVKAVTNATDGAKFVAETMMFDHDALLFGEEPAASTDQGVGMFVNSAGEEIEVINSAYDDAERDMDWAADSLLRAVEKSERAPLIEKIKSLIRELIHGAVKQNDDAVLTNQEGSEVDETQIKELSTKVEAATAALAGLDEKVALAVNTALKPLLDAQEAAAAKAREDDAAAHAVLVNKVVEAKLLDEPSAKEASATVLTALLANSTQPRAAFTVNRAFAPANKTDRAALLPKGDA